MTLLLALLACSATEDDTATGPSLSWVTPSDGADISAGTADCTVAVDGFTLGDEGYVAYGIGAGNEAGQATTPTFTLDIPAGEATLWAELFLTDGSELSPPVSATINVVAMSE